MNSFEFQFNRVELNNKIKINEIKLNRIKLNERSYDSNYVKYFQTYWKWKSRQNHWPRDCKTTFRDFATFMHLCKASIGTGILFLPNGFRRAGYVMSVICGVVIGLLCTHTVVALVSNQTEWKWTDLCVIIN